MNYEADQISRVLCSGAEEDGTYALCLQRRRASDGKGAATKWLNLTGAQAAQIQEMLEADEDVDELQQRALTRSQIKRQIAKLAGDFWVIDTDTPERWQITSEIQTLTERYVAAGGLRSAIDSVTRQR